MSNWGSSFSNSFQGAFRMASENRRANAEDKRAQEEHDARMEDIKDKKGLEADLAAASGPKYTGSNFNDQGWRDESSANEERAALEAKQAPAPAQGAALPPPPSAGVPPHPAVAAAAMAPQDDLAPLPDSPAQGQYYPDKAAPAGAMPTAAPAAAPVAAPTPAQTSQFKTVRDPYTNRWHNVPADQVRDPSDVDIARAQSAVLMKHGKPTEAYSLLNQFFQNKIVQTGFDKGQAQDALSRAMISPDGFAKVTNNLFSGFGMDVEVHAVQVPGPNGQAFPALQLNQKGSNAPPMFLDMGPDGVTMTAKPTPGMYQRQVALIQGMVQGNIADAMTHIVTTQSALLNMAATRQSMAQSGEAFPLEQEGRRTNIQATRQSIAASQQGMGIQRDENDRQTGVYDYTVPEDIRRGITIERQNNPGALKWDKSYRKYGAVPGRNDMASFPSLEAGQRAQEDLVGRKIGALGTIAKIIATPGRGYSPVGPENTFEQTRNYVNYLSRRLGVGPEDNLKPQDAPRLAAAMREWETGHHQTGALPAASGSDLSRKDQAVVANRASTRLATLRDNAVRLAAQSVNPSDAQEFNSAVQMILGQLITHEPDDVRQVFRQQYASRQVPFPTQRR